MNRQAFRAVLAAAAGLGLLSTTVLRADTVKLKDERSFVGRITQETKDLVVIDTMVVGIRTQMELKKAEVASMTREAVPDDFFAPRKGPQPAPATPSPAPGNTAPPATTRPAGEVVFPTFGLAVTPPEGWQRREDESNTTDVAYWVKLADDRRTVVAVIRVDCILKRGATARDVAREVAAERGGQMDPRATVLDGEAAFQVRLSPPGNDAAGPLGVIISTRHGALYVVGVFGPRGTDLDAELEWMRAHWHWVPPESAGTHLALRQTPVRVLDGRLSVRLPAIARPDPKHARADNAMFFVYDLGIPRDAMAIQISISPKQADEALPDFAEGYGRVMRSSPKRKLSADIRWSRVEGGRLPWLAGQFVLATSTTEKGVQGAKHIRYALFSPTPDSVVLSQFIVDTGVEGDLPRYLAASTQVLQSVEWLGRK